MAIRTLKMSELRGLSASEIAARVASFGKSQPANGELASLQERIAEFEIRYELSSETMRAQFHTGQLKETADICKWLMLLSVREGITASHE